MKVVKEIIPYVIVVLIVVLIRSFVVTPVRVNGSSMYPTLENNELLLLKKYDKSYKRFDIIVFKYQDTRLVKRIIGLPGEHVKYQNKKLYINGKVVAENFDKGETDNFDLNYLEYETIPKGYYFVMGDNRQNSTDSRIIGLVKKDIILGKTNFAFFPFKHFGNFE